MQLCYQEAPKSKRKKKKQRKTKNIKLERKTSSHEGSLHKHSMWNMTEVWVMLKFGPVAHFVLIFLPHSKGKRKYGSHAPFCFKFLSPLALFFHPSI